MNILSMEEMTAVHAQHRSQAWDVAGSRRADIEELKRDKRELEELGAPLKMIEQIDNDIKAIDREWRAVPLAEKHRELRADMVPDYVEPYSYLNQTWHNTDHRNSDEWYINECCQIPQPEEEIGVF